MPEERVRHHAKTIQGGLAPTAAAAAAEPLLTVLPGWPCPVEAQAVSTRRWKRATRAGSTEPALRVCVLSGPEWPEDPVPH